MEESKKNTCSDPQPPNLGGKGSTRDYIFETRMEVRDYECDIEGIVNNAQYIHYCEHTRPDDEFISRLNLTKEGIKYVFHQDIYRASDEQLCFRGKIELVCLINGRLGNSPDYDAAFERYLSPLS